MMTTAAGRPGMQGAKFASFYISDGQGEAGNQTFGEFRLSGTLGPKTGYERREDAVAAAVKLSAGAEPAIAVVDQPHGTFLARITRSDQMFGDYGPSESTGIAVNLEKLTPPPDRDYAWKSAQSRYYLGESTAVSDEVWTIVDGAARYRTEEVRIKGDPNVRYRYVPEIDTE